MRLLHDGPHKVWFGRDEPPYSLACPVDGEEYALLLVVADAGISADDQARLSEEIVRTGCRYAVSFGPTSSSWDDSIDMVGVLDEQDGRPGAFVMTSWHDDEPVEDAVDFLVDCTTFDDWSPRRFVVWMLGGSDSFEREVLRALRRRFPSRG